METVAAIASICVALSLGIVSPGPSFVMVARTALAVSRNAGLAASAGMGVGGVVFAFAALLGLHAVFVAVPWAYTALRLVGGAYLVYLGVMIWRGAAQPLRMEADAGEGVAVMSLRRAFLFGLGTQLSNPKTAIIYASVFAALLPAHVPAWVFVVLPVLVFVLEAGWYAIVAWTLTGERLRARYLRAKTWIDRAAGGVMTLLGLRLMVR